jgi:hypothetical protein
MQEVYIVLLAHWLKGRQDQQLGCMGQSELQLTDQKLSFGYTYTYVTIHGLYALPANSSQPLEPIFPLISVGTFHTLYPVSKNRLISAAVQFTAKSTECIFSDNLITIISWGQLQGYRKLQSSPINLVYILWSTVCRMLPWFAQVDGKMVQDGCCVACGYLLMEKIDKKWYILHHFSIRR